MSDPNIKNSPPRGPYQREQQSYTGWIIGGLAALAVVAGLVYAMSDHNPTARTPTSQTTGQSGQPPSSTVPGAPANR
jgi:hypothetical protein